MARPETIWSPALRQERIAAEEPNAFFQHGDGGIAKARVLEARVLILEAGLGLLGAVVNKALRQKERLGRFAKLGTQYTTVHEPGFGCPSGGIG